MPSVMMIRVVVLSVLLSIGMPAGAQSAAPKRAQSVAEIIGSMPDALNVRGVTIAPDGSRVAYFAAGRLMVQELANGAARGNAVEVSAGGLELRDAAWSPDSRFLAFLADLTGTKPVAQLWIASTAALTKPRKVAEFAGYASDPAYSPDGKQIALLFIAGIPRVAGPLVPMTPPEGVIEEHFYEQRITTVDPASGAVKQVSPADMYVYEFDWTPDSRGWAAIAAHGNGDANWWIARLYTTDASGTMKEIYKPKLQIAQPRVSPDGHQVAFVEGIMSDQGVVGGDLFTVSTAGGEAKNLTPGIKASATSMAWTSPTELLVAENIDGDSGVATVSTSGDIKQLWHGFESVNGPGWGLGFSQTRDAKMTAVIRQSFTAPAEVWVGPIGQWKQVSSVNAAIKPAWGEARNVHWKNGDQSVQGWLLFPREYQQNEKYPMVVSVHGGPSSACMPRFNSGDGQLSAAGYFVLCPNPRGSYGQGEAFTQGNVKDFGGGDFKDIMTGIDALAAQFPIDVNRLGIRGHSYGGYMTMWAETQTTRFKAAVAGAGLSNWLSYYGENDIDEWMIPFFGASVYDDPAVYDKSSPIKFVKNVKTPTLIVVGDRDGEVPAPQSFEWWHALKTLGVPVQFVVYPNEGHAISKPEHQHDMHVRTLEWFQKYLK